MSDSAIALCVDIGLSKLLERTSLERKITASCSFIIFWCVVVAQLFLGILFLDLYENGIERKMFLICDCGIKYSGY